MDGSPDVDEAACTSVVMGGESHGVETRLNHDEDDEDDADEDDEDDEDEDDEDEDE
jgi:hypothetical protein